MIALSESVYCSTLISTGSHYLHKSLMSRYGTSECIFVDTFRAHNYPFWSTCPRGKKPLALTSWAWLIILLIRCMLMWLLGSLTRLLFFGSWHLNLCLYWLLRCVHPAYRSCTFVLAYKHKYPVSWPSCAALNCILELEHATVLMFWLSGSLITDVLYALINFLAFTCYVIVLIVS